MDDARGRGGSAEERDEGGGVRIGCEHDVRGRGAAAEERFFEAAEVARRFEGDVDVAVDDGAVSACCPERSSPCVLRFAPRRTLLTSATLCDIGARGGGRPLVFACFFVLPERRIDDEDDDDEELASDERELSRDIEPSSATACAARRRGEGDGGSALSRGLCAIRLAPGV